MFNYIQNQLESRVWQRDLLNKYLGKVAIKKPLWIVESGNKDRRGDFMDGLNWAQRLCAGARVGINSIMRKPSLLSLSEPTPVIIKLNEFIFYFKIMLHYLSYIYISYYICTVTINLQTKISIIHA